MAETRVHIYISGSVQGVFFRGSIRNKAMELGVKGYARNLDDGRVYAVLEGEEASLRKLIEWCKTGPPGAEVEKVEVTSDTYSGEFQTFGIEY
ncbi:MAG: acylphosphatase [Nitrososphaeria archaeon]|jgi:acylphosphatase